MLEANSRTVVRLTRVPKITERFYQNSALTVPAATEESKNLCTAKLRGTTCKKLFKSEHELSNGCNLSQLQWFFYTEKIRARESLFQSRNKTTFS